MALSAGCIAAQNGIANFLRSTRSEENASPERQAEINRQLYSLIAARDSTCRGVADNQSTSTTTATTSGATTEPTDTGTDTRNSGGGSSFSFGSSGGSSTFEPTSSSASGSSGGTSRSGSIVPNTFALDEQNANIRNQILSMIRGQQGFSGEAQGGNVAPFDYEPARNALNASIQGNRDLQVGNFNLTVNPRLRAGAINAGQYGSTRDLGARGVAMGLFGQGLAQGDMEQRRALEEEILGIEGTRNRANTYLEAGRTPGFSDIMSLWRQ